MSAPYSESLFVLASVAHMYHIEKRQYTQATVALAVASGARSNGLVMAGYPCYVALHSLLTENADVRKRMNLIG